MLSSQKNKKIFQAGWRKCSGSIVLGARCKIRLSLEMIEPTPDGVALTVC